MANIFEIKVKQTKNLGNYESKTIEASMQLEDNEDTELAMLDLQEYVLKALNGVKPTHIKEVVKGGNVLTMDNKVKDPNNGKLADLGEVPPKLPTKKKATKKKVVKKEVKEVVEVSADLIKSSLQKIWKTKGKSVAKDILKDFKAEKITDIAVSDYKAVYAECLKCL